jgi:cyclohexanone monooxygenase
VSDSELDAVVVGAGFAGLYMLHKLRGLGSRVQLFEAGSSVGGTWFWNRYRGARCDVESLDYSYSFSDALQQEWRWTERFPSQPELLRYLNHVADRFDLRPDIQLGTRVEAAAFDETTLRWEVQTDRGDYVTCQHLILAVGCLSAAAARVPDFPGLGTFGGNWYHTCDWPVDGVDFAGKRVGVVGTGSSGVQVIPVIAREAAHLTVFQRTPNFSIPARNHPLDDDYQREFKKRYDERREMLRHANFFFAGARSARTTPPDELRAEYETRWQAGGPGFLAAFGDLLLDQEANDTAADFVRAKIREIVHDPEVAERLIPRGFPLGAKRPCIDTDYFDTYNRGNVTLVDVNEAPIEKITPTGLRTAAGSHELDAIVFATGFDAMTGALLAIDIRGRDGVRLRDKWVAGPRTYLGVATAGFPNMFIITGPGSPSVISNMVMSIEQHVEWIGDHVEFMRSRGLKGSEADVGAEDRWVERVREVADRTLFPKATNSWYLGANIPGKPRVFMPYVGGVGPYRQICDDIVVKGYEGFSFTPEGQHNTMAPAAAAGRRTSQHR